MIIILSNAIINIRNITSIYNKGGFLCLETTTGVFFCSDHTNDALQRIAVAISEGKTFLELDNELIIEEDNNDTGSDIK